MNPPILDKAITALLNKHKDKEFVRRILNPEKAPPPLLLPDGIESHRMAAEVDGKGNWFVFPTIINKGGKLVKINDGQQARRENAKNGEVISFGKDGEAAIAFSKNYKTNKFLEHAKRYNETRQNVSPVSSVNLSNLPGRR